MNHSSRRGAACTPYPRPPRRYPSPRRAPGRPPLLLIIIYLHFVLT